MDRKVVSVVVGFFVLPAPATSSRTAIACWPSEASWPAADGSRALR